MKTKILRSLLIVLALSGVVIYLLVFVFSNPDELYHAFVGFEWKLLPLILLLTLCNLTIRFFRWHYLCHKLPLNADVGHNIGIFGAGLVATLTPAKSGELIKSYLLKERYNCPISSSAPMVLMERVFDMLALLVLSGTALIGYSMNNLSLVSNWLYFAIACFLIFLLAVVLVFLVLLTTRRVTIKTL